MKRAACGVQRVLGGIVVLASSVLPCAAQTSLSIYKDGRVVVRRAIPQALAQGRNTLTLRLEALDPATLFSTDTAVSIVSATVRYPTTQADALTRSVGQTLSFLRERGERTETIQATVLRVDPPQYRLASGLIMLSVPGEPLFPPELVRTQPEAQVALEAARARPRAELAYVAEGMRWEALYQVVVLGTRGLVSGTATIRSESLGADSAQVQLVAGSIRRVREADFAARRARAEQLQGVVVAGAAAEMQEEAVGETHVYELPGRLTIQPGVPSATALFPRSSAPLMHELIVPGVLPWRGWIGQEPEPNRVPVQVWYTVRRDRNTAFGRRPLPAGVVQLYQADSAGRLQLIGEASNDHTAPGRDLRVQSGDAFDVTAERVQTTFNQEQIDRQRRRVTASYRVTITNAKTEAVTVDVRERRFGDWRITESSVPAERISSTEARFRLRVPAEGEATLTYTVQIES